MKVHVVVSGLMYGGGQQVVEGIMEESLQWKDVSVSLSLLGGAVGPLSSLGAHIVDYNGKYNNPLVLWNSASGLRRVVREASPGILHSHGWDAAMVGALALRGMGLPHVVHVHTCDSWLKSSSMKHRVRRAMTRWMFRGSLTKVVAVSKAVRMHWMSSLGQTGIDISVVHNGIDVSRFKPDGRGRGARSEGTIGVAARLAPGKGLEDLLQAIHLLSGMGHRPRLSVAGDGPLKHFLEESVRRLALDERVKFYGHVDDMPSFFRELDIAVLPSWSEGLPLAVMEAMACGVPVIASDVGGISEVLRNGQDGLVVPARRPDLLAEAFEKVLADPGGRRAMGESARHRIESSFSRELFGIRMLKLYRDALVGSNVN